MQHFARKIPATEGIEMLTGKPGFEGGSAVAIFHAILYDSPPALSGSPAVSAIDRILRRALSKSPEDRFQDADAMAAELRNSVRITSRAWASSTRSL